MQDNRITYSNQEIKVDGNVVRFDGKGHKESKTLKVYRYYGDIRVHEQAIQEFAIVNGYDTVHDQSR